MVQKRYNKPPWQEPNLGLRASKEIVDRQRKVLLGETVPGLDPSRTCVAATACPPISIRASLRA